jgi:F-type H+-transporting ATPase subunit b
VVLILILWKLAYKPLMSIQERRQAEIHEAIEGAERVKEEARVLLGEYRQQLSDARQESEEILERSRKVAEAARAEIIDEARVQAERMLEKAREQIERDARQALTEIREEVADLTLAAAEKVTSKKLTDEDDLRLIREALADIEMMNVNKN